MEKVMNKSKLLKASGLFTFLVVLGLIMAACAPAAATAVIPNTGANGTPNPQTGMTATLPVGMIIAGTLNAGMMPSGLGGPMMLANDPKLGDFLAGANGMTLYIYTKDIPGVSNCTGGCLANWPPLVATGDLLAAPGIPGKLAFITRADGTTQATYNGMPLYYFSGDKAPGDTTGQGVGGVWYMMSPTNPIK
jgi:predicted lipoprotein with Yx(FWY)xxD motif